MEPGADSPAEGSQSAAVVRRAFRQFPAAGRERLRRVARRTSRAMWGATRTCTGLWTRSDRRRSMFRFTVRVARVRRCIRSVSVLSEQEDQELQRQINDCCS